MKYGFSIRPAVAGRRVLTLCILCTIFAGTAVFAGGDQEVWTTGDQDSAHQLLIAYDSSETKDAILRGVIEELSGKKIGITVIDLDLLKDYAIEPFGAIFIMNRGMAMRVDPDVRKFLEQAPDPDAILVLTTQGMAGKWTPDIAVDSITSASKEEEVPAKVTEIVGWILQTLGM